jgi:hypothetical protein
MNLCITSFVVEAAAEHSKYSDDGLTPSIAEYAVFVPVCLRLANGGTICNRIVMMVGVAARVRWSISSAMRRYLQQDWMHRGTVARLSIGAQGPGKSGRTENEAFWQAVWAYLKRRSTRRGSEQYIRINMGTGALFTSIGRFGALAVISSPLVMWISAYVWAYLFRIDICKNKILNSSNLYTQIAKDGVSPSLPGFLGRTGWESEETSLPLSNRVFGQDDVLTKLRDFLASTPRQVCLVSAPNNAGKTHIIRSSLEGRSKTVFISLSRFPVTSVSNLVQSVTSQLGIKLLSIRKILTDLLPFAGGEVLVLKERQTVEDLKDSLDVVTAALERIQADDPNSNESPVIVFDGITDTINTSAAWQHSREGQEAIQVLLGWAEFVTKERHLAHVVFSTSNVQASWCCWYCR